MYKRIYWYIISLSRNNRIFRVSIDYLAFLYYILFRSNRIFTYRGERYKYFYHLYNRTVAGERVIEIPIAKKLLGRYEGKNILEVGNVLSHYFPITHTVLDKYERSPRVINKDVASVKLKSKFDLIISISTMEHVGYSYGEQKDPNKFSKGIANLKRHLKNNGVLFVTFPLYINPGIDRLFRNNRMPFDHGFYMKRTSFLNEWKQVSKKDAKNAAVYDGDYANANILYIGLFTRTK